MAEVDEPVSKPPGRRPWWWVAAGAVLAAAVLLGVLWSARGGEPSAGGPPTMPSPVATDPATTTAEPSTSPSASPTPTSTRKLTPYCRDYLAILGGGPSGDPPDDEASPDTGSLSDTYAKWLQRYTAASVHAPADLRPRYAKVIRYLKDAKITFDTGDWNATRAQLKQLPTLNKAMDDIETRSKRLCG